MFQRLRFKDREEVSLPEQTEEERLTRYGPDDERPEGSASLTRFSRRHIRDGASQRMRDTPQPNAAQPQPEPQQGPDLDLYSNEPISINVLMRALPQRFADVQADISEVFDLNDNRSRPA